MTRDREVGLNHNSTLTHTVTSTDAGYNNLAVPNVVVNVADNDCGVWGYAPSDINKDCQVTLEDFAIFAIRVDDLLGPVYRGMRQSAPTVVRQTENVNRFVPN